MTQYLLTELMLRRQVENRLKIRVPERIWSYFLKRGAVGEARQRTDGPKWLAKGIQDFLSAAKLPRRDGGLLPAPETPRRQRRGKVVSARDEAISEFIAAEARRDEAVVAFRSRYLSEKLLSRSTVASWIDDQTCEYDHAVAVRVPRGMQYRLSPDRRHLIPELTSVKPEDIENLLPVDCVAYENWPCGWVHRRPAGRDGVLRTLLLLSRSLAQAFGWTEDQATMFVLTDGTPQIVSARWELKPVAPMASMARVTFTISLEVSPEELAKKYKHIRSKILGPKHRSLGAKHCRLAVFALKHPVLNQEVLRVWNKEYPEWSYSKVNRFAEQARLASKRMATTLRRPRFDPVKHIQALDPESKVEQQPPVEWVIDTRTQELRRLKPDDSGVSM